ncbi:hypothetical protein PCCS19_07250 [Paenibacillus sp. CCS19]|nr:hypothetical protein PCCS19_07250 [Paenibacillus cellulosilyticus]
MTKRKSKRIGGGLLAAVMAVGMWTGGTVQAADLFTDNFDDGNATGWTATTGTWSVVQDSGNYVYYQSSTSEGRTSGGSATWTNYSVQSRIKVDSFNGSNRIYLAGRYKDGNNYYAASFDNSNGGTLELRKKVSGSSSTLATKSYALSAGTWYTIKLEMNGSSIKMYVNGVLQLSATDTSLTSGAVGLVAFKTATKYDDIVVSDLSGSTTDPGTTDPGTTDPGTGTGTTTPATGDLIVAPNGSASNPGTLSQPTTLASALTKIAAGKTIYLRGGTYSYSAPLTIDRANSGASTSSRKQIAAYNGEKPVLDFSGEAFDSAQRGLQVFGHYWLVKDIRVTGAGDNGIYVGGNYNRIENVETDHNRDTGLQLGRYNSSVGYADWPKYNEIINAYSHDNYDPDNGEDADGFAAKLTVGPGNVFDGCISAYNVDDGWDLYTKSDTGAIGAVTIRNSIAHHNGQTSNGTSTTDSDGNGFKLGGESIAVNHIVINSIAYSNKKHGFTYNSNPGSITMTNNTSYSNGGSNFAFDAGTHVFSNNLSFQGSSSDKTSGTDVSGTNVWWKNGASTNAKGLVVSSADFVSLTPSISRAANGAPVLGNFLKLATGSDLKSAGTPAGTDIGAKF